MAKTTKTPVETPAEQISSEQVQQPIAITIGDLKLMNELLQVASSRNTFSSIEMGVASQLIFKLNTFITVVEAQAQAANTEQTPTEE